MILNHNYIVRTVFTASIAELKKLNNQRGYTERFAAAAAGGQTLKMINQRSQEEIRYITTSSQQQLL